MCGMAHTHSRPVRALGSGIANWRTLNRRVLDRTLGAILGYIMQRPGLVVSSICERFTPALQPQHCRELVELLEEIKCVQLQKFLNKPRKMSGLFSKSSVDDLMLSNNVTMLDGNDVVIVEPNVNAIAILGQFIGERRYDVADIYQCPCHPK